MPVEVIVDATGLGGEEGARFGDDVSEALRSRLINAGFMVVDDGASVIIETRLHLSNDELRNYVVDIDIIIDGRREVVHEADVCSVCTEQGLIDRSLQLLVDAAVRVPWQTSVANVDDLAPPSGVGVEPVEVEQPRTPALELGPLGFTGALLIAGGAGSVVGGVAALTMGASPESQAVGGAIVGLGILFVGAGVTALVSDREHIKRERQVGVGFDVSQTRASLVISGVF